MMKSSVKLTLMFSVACCNTAVLAQGLPAGPARVYPQIGLTLKHDSNILQSPDNEKSSLVTELTPQVRLEHKQQANTYGLNAGAKIGRYSSSSADNYEDYQVSGDADWQFARNMGFSLGADYMMGHDPRGSTDRGDGGKPATWDTKGVSGLFSYGGHQARTRIELGAGHAAKRYDDYPLSQNVDDKNDTDITARFIYRALPKTRLFLEAIQTMTDYQLDTSTQDNDKLNFSMGAKWSATAKTTGSAKVGYLRKTFDSDAREDFSGLSWQMAVQWKPISRSTIDVTTGRYTNDSTGIGDYLLTQDFSIKGTHVWMPRLSSSLGFYMGQTDFSGDKRATERSDDNQKYSLAVNYDLRKEVTLSAGMNFGKRDSNYSPDDYDQRVFFLTVNAGF
jgi:hypothetical protein